jgi:hypothetical protein
MGRPSHMNAEGTEQYDLGHLRRDGQNATSCALPGKWHKSIRVEALFVPCMVPGYVRLTCESW